MNPTMVRNAPITLFSTKSDAYARGRPGYPDALIAEILAPFSDLPRRLAADIGAGTGISSRALAGRGIPVVAIEPDAAMIGAAEAHPAIDFRRAAAEETGLPDGSVDLVTSFQAFHWFRFGASLREFRRILRPSGRLALVWYHWDRGDPFTGRYADLLGEAGRRNRDRISPFRGPAGRIKQVRLRALWKLGILPCFRHVRRSRFRYRQEVDAGSLIEGARSQSNLVHAGPAWEALVEEIGRLASGQGEGARLSYRVDLYTATPRN